MRNNLKGYFSYVIMIFGGFLDELQANIRAMAQ